jgi:hypothetical protein
VLAEEERRQQLKYEYDHLTQNALLTGRWHDVHTFNMELSRRLHSATPPPNYSPASPREFDEYKAEFALRPVTPGPNTDQEFDTTDEIEHEKDEEN